MNTSLEGGGKGHAERRQMYQASKLLIRVKKE